MIEIDKFELRRRRTRRCAFLLEGKLRDILGKMKGHTHKSSNGWRGPRKAWENESCLFVCLHLEPDNDGGRITEMLESLANEPFNLKHHAAYIRLALQMQDGREMAVLDAGSDGKRGTGNRRQVIRVLGAYWSPSNNLTYI